MKTHDHGEDMALIPMQFQDYNIQIIVEQGVTWWSARGIMYILGMNKQGTSQLMARLEDDEKRLFTIYTNRGPRETWFINEHGLYDLLMKSRKPEAIWGTLPARVTRRDTAPARGAAGPPRWGCHVASCCARASSSAVSATCRQPTALPVSRRQRCSRRLSRITRRRYVCARLAWGEPAGQVGRGRVR